MQDNMLVEREQPLQTCQKRRHDASRQTLMHIHADPNQR